VDLSQIDFPARPTIEDHDGSGVLPTTAPTLCCRLH
jgi:hypothetical protein